MKKSGLLLISVLLISLILLSFVAAGTNLDNILNKISGASFDFTPGTGFAKILMFILVGLVVFAIAESLPFTGDNDWIAGGISIIIALLSITYLKLDEVYSILLSYSALGIAITSIIPFIVIAVLSKKLFEHGHAMISRIIWIVFGVALTLKWLLADTSQIGKFGTWLYPITLILIFFMILWQNWLFNRLFSENLKAKTGEWGRMQDLIREGDKAKARSYAESLPMNAGQRKSIEKELARMK